MCIIISSTKNTTTVQRRPFYSHTYGCYLSQSKFTACVDRMCGQDVLPHILSKLKLLSISTTRVQNPGFARLIYGCGGIGEERRYSNGGSRRLSHGRLVASRRVDESVSECQVDWNENVSLSKSPWKPIESIHEPPTVHRHNAVHHADQSTRTTCIVQWGPQQAQPAAARRHSRSLTDRCTSSGSSAPT